METLMTVYEEWKKEKGFSNDFVNNTLLSRFSPHVGWKKENVDKAIQAIKEGKGHPYLILHDHVVDGLRVVFEQAARTSRSRLTDLCTNTFGMNEAQTATVLGFYAKELEAGKMEEGKDDDEEGLKEQSERMLDAYKEWLSRGDTAIPSYAKTIAATLVKRLNIIQLADLKRNNFKKVIVTAVHHLQSPISWGKEEEYISTHVADALRLVLEDAEPSDLEELCKQMALNKEQIKKVLEFYGVESEAEMDELYAAYLEWKKSTAGSHTRNVNIALIKKLVFGEPLEERNVKKALDVIKNWSEKHPRLVVTRIADGLRVILEHEAKISRAHIMQFCEDMSFTGMQKETVLEFYAKNEEAKMDDDGYDELYAAYLEWKKSTMGSHHSVGIHEALIQDMLKNAPWEKVNAKKALDAIKEWNHEKRPFMAIRTIANGLRVILEHKAKGSKEHLMEFCFEMGFTDAQKKNILDFYAKGGKKSEEGKMDVVVAMADREKVQELMMLYAIWSVRDIAQRHVSLIKSTLVNRLAFNRMPGKIEDVGTASWNIKYEKSANQPEESFVYLIATGLNVALEDAASESVSKLQLRCETIRFDDEETKTVLAFYERKKVFNDLKDAYVQWRKKAPIDLKATIHNQIRPMFKHHDEIVKQELDLTKQAVHYLTEWKKEEAKFDEMVVHGIVEYLKVHTPDRKRDEVFRLIGFTNAEIHKINRENDLVRKAIDESNLDALAFATKELTEAYDEWVEGKPALVKNVLRVNLVLQMEKKRVLPSEWRVHIDKAVSALKDTKRKIDTVFYKEVTDGLLVMMYYGCLRDGGALERVFDTFEFTDLDRQRVKETYNAPKQVVEGPTAMITLIMKYKDRNKPVNNNTEKVQAARIERGKKARLLSREAPAKDSVVEYYLDGCRRNGFIVEGSKYKIVRFHSASNNITFQVECVEAQELSLALDVNFETLLKYETAKGLRLIHPKRSIDNTYLLPRKGGVYIGKLCAMEDLDDWFLRVITLNKHVSAEGYKAIVPFYGSAEIVYPFAARWVIMGKIDCDPLRDRPLSGKQTAQYKAAREFLIDIKIPEARTDSNEGGNVFICNGAEDDVKLIDFGGADLRGKKLFPSFLFEAIKKWNFEKRDKAEEGMMVKPPLLCFEYNPLTGKCPHLVECMHCHEKSTCVLTRGLSCERCEKNVFGGETGDLFPEMDPPQINTILKKKKETSSSEEEEEKKAAVAVDEKKVKELKDVDKIVDHFLGIITVLKSQKAELEKELQLCKLENALRKKKEGRGNKRPMRSEEEKKESRPAKEGKKEEEDAMAVVGKGSSKVFGDGHALPLPWSADAQYELIHTVLRNLYVYKLCQRTSFYTNPRHSNLSDILSKYQSLWNDEYREAKQTDLESVTNILIPSAKDDLERNNPMLVTELAKALKANAMDALRGSNPLGFFKKHTEEEILIITRVHFSNACFLPPFNLAAVDQLRQRLSPAQKAQYNDYLSRH